MKFNRFAKGSGCYRCRCCGKLTRKTGYGDGAGVELCEPCYEAAGYENQHSDESHDESPRSDCPICRGEQKDMNGVTKRHLPPEVTA